MNHTSHHQNKMDYDIIIVGAGITALTLALACQQVSLKVGLIEAKPEPAVFSDEGAYGLRVSAITRASENVFRRLNVWQEMLAHRHSEYMQMKVWDENSRGKVEFTAKLLSQPNLGYILENDMVQSVLTQKVKETEGIDCYYQSPGKSIDLSNPEMPMVCLKDGKLLRAHCLVGADGGRSWFRSEVGMPSRIKAYQQKAIVANVRTEKSHNFTARQIFLSQGPLAFLPMSDEHVCSIVWTQDANQADTICLLDDAAFNKFLTKCFQSTLGECEVQGQRAAFPLIQSHAKHYIKPGCVLIGDAAHTIHPLAGMGLNLGVLDAACLAEVFTNAHEKNRPLASHGTLRRYERQRRWHNGVVMRLMDVFHIGFTNQSPWLVRGREAGMQMVNHFDCLKQPIIKQAMGLAGPLPEMASGNS